MAETGTLLQISIGKSRFDKNWQNRRVYFGSLAGVLTKENRTKETMAEYLAMPKSEQDRIKDVGGFVGGFLEDGLRRGESVKGRNLVTLDVDEGYPGILEQLRILSPWRMIVYSTHKHTPEKPRLRIVIPMMQMISANAYEPLARMAASMLGVGMDCFDDTTFQPARLMYFPSTPKDGEHVGEVINPDGPELDSAEVMRAYGPGESWKDASKWPVSSREGQRILHANTKLGDPKDKPGIVGWFCRAYSVTEAMSAFLSDVYKPEEDGRWTYINGSTSHGVVVYDDQYAYSNHGTDPAHGKSLNAFDLVRVHRFGALDEGADPEARMGDLPSYRAMAKLAREDEKVKEEMAMDMKEKDARELAGMGEPTGDWKDELRRNRLGKTIPDARNVELIMENDPGLKGLCVLNAFGNVREYSRKAPWDRGSEADEVWGGADDAQLRVYLDKEYGISNAKLVDDVLLCAAQRRSYNPVKDYIESAKWDGKPRCEELFVRYLGAEDSEYVRTVTRKMLVAAVKRVYEPGCKFDYMVTLVGKQGIGKSLLAQKLGAKWFSDTLPDVRGKQAYEALSGRWIIEMGELSALKKADRESIKLFISKTEDTYRWVYEHNVAPHRRTCIFIGTTNDDDFLNDSTGARRFLVIDTDARRATATVWEDLTDGEVSQVWAEALVLYRKGEDPMAMPESVRKKAEQEQEAHGADDALSGIIGAFLEERIPDGWEGKTISERMTWFRSTRDFKRGEANGSSLMGEEGSDGLRKRGKICSYEIWCECLQREFGTMELPDTWRIRDAMRALGWKKSKKLGSFGPYGRQKYYERPATGAERERNGEEAVAGEEGAENATATTETTPGK